MPIEKFRTIGEMNAARVLTSDEQAFERFLRHCARYRAIASRSYPQGVFKFRSLEEAQTARSKQK